MVGLDDGKLGEVNILVTKEHLKLLKTPKGGYLQKLISYAQGLTGQQQWAKALEGALVTRETMDHMITISQPKPKKPKTKPKVINKISKPDGWAWNPDKTDIPAPKVKGKANKAKRDAVSRLSGAKFYASNEWLTLRVRVLRNHGRKCVLCGATPADGAVMHVDHIIPRSKRPDLSLDYNNLQVLCKCCNLGKSNKYSEDWRDQDGEQRRHDLAMIEAQSIFFDKGPSEEELLRDRYTELMSEAAQILDRLGDFNQPKTN